MKKLMIYLPLLLLVVFVGCNIITGNKLIVIELDDVTVNESSNGFEKWLVNKDSLDDSTWRDHADDLNHVVDLGFAVEITNNDNTEAKATFYVSTNGTFGTADDVIDSATVVLGPITVPAGPDGMKKITWQQSYDYLHHFDTLKDLVLLGEFYLYAVGVSPHVNLDFEKTAVILTVNVKP